MKKTTKIFEAEDVFTLIILLVIFLILYTPVKFITPKLWNIAVSVEKKVESQIAVQMYKIHIAQIRRETRVEWIEFQKRWILDLRRAVGKIDSELKACEDFINNNPKFSEFERRQIMQSHHRETRPERFALIQWHNRVVQQYNVAIMRYCAGSQYRGVEKTLFPEVKQF